MTTQPRYAFCRVDTATRVRREALLAQAPGWGSIATDRPQFAIVDRATTNVPADWPLIETYAEAVAVTADLNSADDDEVSRSEARGLARMAGCMDA